MKVAWLSVLMAASAFADLSNPPLLTYSTYLSGKDGSFANGVAVDSAGHAYISGNTQSPDFPFTLPPLGPPASSSSCGFVTKLDPSGTGIVWSVCLTVLSGGPIALDASGSIYVLGTDYQSAASAVTKLTPNADRIVYSISIPALGVGMAVDPSGNVYVAGAAAPGLPTTSGAYQTTPSCGLGETMPCADAFVLKLDPAGAVVYETYLGTSGGANAIAADSQGNVWITGTTFCGGCSVEAGVDPSSFVAKLDSQGANRPSLKTYGGGLGYDAVPAAGLGIVVDSQDAAYAVGTAGYGLPTTPGALDPRGPALPFSFGYLLKFNQNGDLVYGTYLGNSQPASLVAVDGSGYAYLDLSGISFINNAYPACGGGASLVAVSPDGSAIVASYPNFAGEADAIAMDSGGGVYVTGTTTTGVFLSTPQAFQTQWPFHYSAFAAKFDFSQPAGTGLACLVNAASLMAGINNSLGVQDGAVAPGELITLFGQNFTPGPDLKVMFGDIPAPLLYADAGQINAVVPFEVPDLPGSTTSVSIQSGGQTYGPVQLPVAPAQPALFTQGPAVLNQAAILNQDGTLNSSTNPAAPGSVVSVYMTGVGDYKQKLLDGSLGPLAPPFPSPILGVSATINFEQAPVLFVGQAPGLVAGVAQVNVQVPGDAKSGMAPIVVYVGNYASSYFTYIAIR